MCRCFAITLLLALGVVSRPAAADPIAILIEDKDVVPDPAGGTITLDVTIRDTGGEQRRPDDLTGFDMAFILEKVGGGPGGLRFVPPYALKPEAFFLTGPRTEFKIFDPEPSGRSFTLFAFDPDAVRLDVPPEPLDAARLVLAYGPGTPAGEYHVRLNPGFTDFGSGPYGPDILGAVVTDVGVIRLVPEPAAAGLLVLALVPLSRTRFGAKTGGRSHAPRGNPASGR